MRTEGIIMFHFNVHFDFLITLIWHIFWSIRRFYWLFATALSRSFDVFFCIFDVFICSLRRYHVHTKFLSQKLEFDNTSRFSITELYKGNWRHSSDVYVWCHNSRFSIISSFMIPCLLLISPFQNYFLWRTHFIYLFFSRYRVSIADTGNISTIVESLIEHSDWFFPEGKQSLLYHTARR